MPSFIRGEDFLALQRYTAFCYNIKLTETEDKQFPFTSFNILLQFYTVRNIKIDHTRIQAKLKKFRKIKT